MRYPGSEKLEIIRLVEQSHLPVRRTLAMLGILPMTFYRWYARLQAGGPEALEDKPSRPRRVWNKIPEEVREQIVELALDEPEALSAPLLPMERRAPVLGRDDASADNQIDVMTEEQLLRNLESLTPTEPSAALGSTGGGGGGGGGRSGR